MSGQIQIERSIRETIEKRATVEANKKIVKVNKKQTRVSNLIIRNLRRFP